MPFHTNKNTLVKGLRKLRESHCHYRGRDGKVHPRCDCKYGIGEEKGHLPGEATGCPELLSAADLIEALTLQEYDALVHRAMEGPQPRKVDPKIGHKNIEFRVHCPFCSVTNTFNVDTTSKVCHRCGNVFTLDVTVKARGRRRK